VVARPHARFRPTRLTQGTGPRYKTSAACAITYLNRRLSTCQIREVAGNQAACWGAAQSPVGAEIQEERNLQGRHSLQHLAEVVLVVRQALVVEAKVTELHADKLVEVGRRFDRTGHQSLEVDNLVRRTMVDQLVRQLVPVEADCRVALGRVVLAVARCGVGLGLLAYALPHLRDARLCRPFCMRIAL